MWSFVLLRPSSRKDNLISIDAFVHMHTIQLTKSQVVPKVDGHEAGDVCVDMSGLQLYGCVS